MRASASAILEAAMKHLSRNNKTKMNIPFLAHAVLATFFVCLAACGNAEAPKENRLSPEKIAAAPGTAQKPTPGDSSTKQQSAAGKTPPPKVENMIFVVVDTLRADRVGAYGYKQPTTPAIDKLAAEGVLFETLHSASPWTAPSFGSFFTGVSPTIHGAGGMLAKGSSKGTLLFGVTVGGIRKDLPTLTTLIPEGIQTAAIVNNAFVSKNLGFDRGFDHFDHRNAGVHKYRKADETAKRAIEWLEENHENPFFLLVHFFDPHMGYGPPQKYISQFAPNKSRRISVPFTDHDSARDGTLKPSEQEKTFIRGLYDGEVRFVDDEIANIVETMRRLSLLENTWIVVTADHGDEHFEHGSFEHGHAYEDEVTRVPLIIRAPGGKWHAGDRIGASIGHVDITPTLLDLYGVTIPSHFEGRSLLPLVSGLETEHREVYMEYNLFNGQQCAMFDGRYKIVWDTRRKRGFYYDLKTDPGETRRLSSDDPKYKELFALLSAKRAALAKAAKGKVSNKAALSPEAAKALKELGYIK
jgi:arylsulfatase A-like enzyme